MDNNNKGIILSNLSVLLSGSLEDGYLIEQINEHFLPGELIVVTGSNGSGKTSLLETIGGLRKLGSGEIIIDGHNLWQQRKRKNKLNREAILAIGIAMQHTEQQWFAANVKAELEYAMKPYQLSAEEREIRATEAMQTMQLPAELLMEEPWSLSGGQQRRLAIACLLCCQPKWLLLDEPLAGLDHEGVLILQQALMVHKQNGGGIIVITHDTKPFLKLADRIVRVSAGQLVPENKEAYEAMAVPSIAAQHIMAWKQSEPDSKERLSNVISRLSGEKETDLEFEAESKIKTNPAYDANAKVDIKAIQADKNVFSSDHYFDPRAIILSYLIWSAAILVQTHWSMIGVSALLVTAAFVLFRKAAAPMLPVLRGFVILAVILTVIGGLSLSPLEFKWEAASETGQRLAKLVLVMMIGMPIFALITPFRLKRAFEQTFGFLSRVGMPIAPFSMLITLIFRFIPLLMQEWERFGKLARARGKVAAADSAVSIRIAVTMLIPYLRCVIGKAEDIAEALELRGYNQMKQQPVFGYRLKLLRQDYWMLFIVLIISAGLFIAAVK